MTVSFAAVDDPPRSIAEVYATDVGEPLTVPSPIPPTTIEQFGAAVRINSFPAAEATRIDVSPRDIAAGRLR